MRKMSESQIKHYYSKEARDKISKIKMGNNNWLGRKHTEETKAKISESHKGMAVSEEAKKKISEANKGNKYCLGKHLSEETKRKIGEANKGNIGYWKGKPRSEELRQKLIEVNTGRKASKETKEKMSKTAKRNGNKPPVMKGEDNPRWKGGVTSLTHSIRTNYKYRQWVSDVFTRDDFTCNICGIRGSYLHAHHIKSFSSIIQCYEITTLEEALECSELWNINNGITLCKDCHKKIHKKVINNVND